MKMLTKILFAALMLVGVNSAFADTQDRHLSGFHALNLTASFDVYLTQGSTESVKVEAPDDVIDRIITEVNGDVLTVRTKNGVFNWGNWFSGSHKKIVIYVTIKDIHAINISGSSDVFFKDGLHADKFELKISGSGDVVGKLNVKELACSISGSGDITLAGAADSNTIVINGSGDFKSRDLVTGTTIIRVSGSGDATVNATQKLEARVSGSGDIRYTGGANHVSTSSSGSGDIHRF